MKNKEIKQAIKRAKNVYVYLGSVEWSTRISKTEAYELLQRFKVRAYSYDNDSCVELEVSYKD